MKEGDRVEEGRKGYASWSLEGAADLDEPHGSAWPDRSLFSSTEPPQRSIQCMHCQITRSLELFDLADLISY